MMKSLFIRSLVVLGAVISITFAMSTAALAETKSVGQTTFPDLTGAVMVVNNIVPKKPEDICFIARRKYYFFAFVKTPHAETA
jgi:hypothetical protein